MNDKKHPTFYDTSKFICFILVNFLWKFGLYLAFFTIREFGLFKSSLRPNLAFFIFWGLANPAKVFSYLSWLLLKMMKLLPIIFDHDNFTTGVAACKNPKEHITQVSEGPCNQRSWTGEKIIKIIFSWKKDKNLKHRCLSNDHVDINFTWLMLYIFAYN